MHIGANKVIRPKDGTIHMAFRGKMHDRARLVKLQQSAQEFAIAHVSLYEAISRIGRNAEQVSWVAGVGQLVEVNYRSSFLLNPLQDEVGTDETRSSGDHNRFFHVRKPSRRYVAPN